MDDMWRFTIAVDGATIGTAQQKRFDPRTRRFFMPKRVAHGMKVVALLAKSETHKVGAKLPPWGEPAFLSLDFAFAVPKTRRRKRPDPHVPKEGDPCTARWAGDCDNRAKAVIDALTMAGFWPDDQFVTRLSVSKRWTLGSPCIDIAVGPDSRTPAKEAQ